MAFKLKPLREQVIVITGPTSGHGLATARMLARTGARLMLGARNEEALRKLCEEIEQYGGHAGFRVTDVTQRDQVEALAVAAIETYGRFDTWINIAGTTIYGTIEQVPVEDHRQLFETNYWGVVYGSMAAAAHLRKGSGGAIINMGSILGDRAVPLQSGYCATKHAVKGFTNALRVELMHDDAPVSVTLVKPAGVDTPLMYHARNYMPGKPNVPPPPYAPKVVARAVVHACTHKLREISPGGFSIAQIRAADMVPGLSDRIMSVLMYRLEQSFKPRPSHGPDNLYAPGEDLSESSGFKKMVLPVSPLTEARMHPAAPLAMLAAVVCGVGAVAMLRRRSARTPGCARTGQRAVAPCDAPERLESR